MWRPWVFCQPLPGAMTLAGDSTNPVPIAPSWVLFGTGVAALWSQEVEPRHLRWVGTQKTRRKGCGPLLRGGCNEACGLIYASGSAHLFPAAKASQAQARQTGAQEEQAAGDGHVVTSGIVAHEVVIAALIGEVEIKGYYPLRSLGRCRILHCGSRPANYRCHSPQFRR